MSGSKAGSHLRLIDFVNHSILGLRVIKKRRKRRLGSEEMLNETLRVTGSSLMGHVPER